MLYLEFRKFIQGQAKGLRDDPDLRNCYRGIEQDIESLKLEGWIREVNVNMLASLTKDAEEEKVPVASGKPGAVAKEPKQVNRVLFPIDHDDEYVEVREQYPLKGLQLLRTLWNDPKKVITVLNQR